MYHYSTYSGKSLSGLVEPHEEMQKAIQMHSKRKKEKGKATYPEWNTLEGEVYGGL